MGVVEVGEPLDLGRHVGQAVKLGRGQQPVAGGDPGRELAAMASLGSFMGFPVRAFLTLDKICYQE